MARLSRDEAMLRRHYRAMAKFASMSKVTDGLAFIVADTRSKFARALVASGVIITERASVVMPTTMDSIPALLAAAGAIEAQQVVAAGGVPVVCIDDHDVASMSWEPLLPCVGRRREEPAH